MKLNPHELGILNQKDKTIKYLKKKKKENIFVI